MIYFKKILSIFFFGLFVFSLAAQQSSKSKAKDKLYEKGDDDEVIIKNVKSINSEHLEFSPAFYQNGIVFISNRNQDGFKDERIDEYFFELFYADLDGEGMPTAPEEFSVMINSSVHEGPVTFNKRGDLMFFTRNNVKKGRVQYSKNEKVNLKIYQANKGRFDWEEVKELSFNNDNYTVAHPSLSPNGRLLFFASDMPGGFGGMDLYVVEKEGKEWGTPVNLGDQVNTEQNELFPFIHESEILFFASDGRGGEGGLDLFKTQEVDGLWQKAKNMGSPFNSSEDDLGLIMNPDGNKGFFTSSRNGGAGKDDIYYFELQENYQPADQLTAVFSVRDKQSQEPVEGASIRVFERAENGMVSGGDLYDVVLLPSESGSNELVMKLVRKNSTDLGEPDKYSDANGAAAFDMKSDQRYILLVTKDGYENEEMLYTTSGKTAPMTIDIQMKALTCAPLVLKAQNEKNSALVGDVSILLKSDCVDEDVTLKTNAAGNLNYCIPPNCTVTITAEKEGFVKTTKTITAADPSQIYNFDLMLKPIANAPEPIAAGSVIVLENIYYDFNKSTIRSGAVDELDALVNLMRQYPSMEVELLSHTDSRGGTRYNMQLSKKRAASAKRYLVSRGIDSQRITPIGKGETEPRNRCTDGVKCSEREFRYNRRTEVKVVKIDQQVKIQYRN